MPNMPKCTSQHSAIKCWYKTKDGACSKGPEDKDKCRWAKFDCADDGIDKQVKRAKK